MKAKNILKTISISVCALLCAVALVFSGCSYVNPELNVYGMTQEQFDVFIESLESDTDRMQAAIGWATRSNVSMVSFFTEKKTERTQSSGSGSGGFGGIFGGNSGSSSTTTTYYEDFAYDGSGVIVDIADDWSYAYVLTNAHMVCCVDDDVPAEIAYKVYIYMYGQDVPEVNYKLCLYEYDTVDEETIGREYGDTGCEWHWLDCEGDENYRIEASVVACSGQYDLALLKVTNSGSLEIMKRNQAVAAVFSDSDEAYIGESVFAMGNPYGYGQTATVGVVSQDSITLSSDVLDTGTYYEFRQIKTDAAVNSGNSGGGLYDTKGKLVGIVNSKRSSDGTENTGYVLAGSYAKRLVGLMKAEEDKNLAEHGIERAYLYYDYDNEFEPTTLGSYSYSYQTIDTGFSTTFSYGYYDASVNAARIWETVSCTTDQIKGLSEGDVVTHLKIEDPDDNVVEDLDITRKYILDDALLSIHSKDGYKVYLTVEGKDNPVEVDYMWVSQG